MDLDIRSSDTPLHNIYNLRHTLTDRTVSVNQLMDFKDLDRANFLRFA
jgi:hypothetical protein